MCGYLIPWMCMKSSGKTEVYLSSISLTKRGPLPTCSWAWRDRTLSPDPISEPIPIIKGSPSAITDAICGDIMKRETTPPTTWVMLLRPILTHILKELLKSWTSVVSLRQVNQWGLHCNAIYFNPLHYNTKLHNKHNTILEYNSACYMPMHAHTHAHMHARMHAHAHKPVDQFPSFVWVIQGNVLLHECFEQVTPHLHSNVLTSTRQGSNAPYRQKHAKREIQREKDSNINPHYEDFWVAR